MANEFLVKNLWNKLPLMYQFYGFCVTQFKIINLFAANKTEKYQCKWFKKGSFCCKGWGEQRYSFWRDSQTYLQHISSIFQAKWLSAFKSLIPIHIGIKCFLMGGGVSLWAMSLFCPTYWSRNNSFIFLWKFKCLSWLRHYQK